MLESKSVAWHKKIYNKPKELAPSKTGEDEAHLLENSNDHKHNDHGWRKTLHASRPVTPKSDATRTSTPVADGVDETGSEQSDASPPHQDSRPKPARYTSLFNSSKEVAREVFFSEPWSEDAPPLFQPYVNPLDALQSIQSHMTRSPCIPIPVVHNTGLFRIFEDYRKVREQKEDLQSKLEEVFEGLEEAEEEWLESERCYKAEIRRLVSLNRRGASGMSG